MSAVAQVVREETTFLSEGGVLVTNARLVANGQTYAIGGVTSVKRIMEPAKNGFGVICIIAGILCLLLGIGQGTDGAVLIMVGLGALVLGIAIVKNQKDTHHLILTSASGEMRAITAQDPAFIGRVLTAVNNAIVSRS